MQFNLLVWSAGCLLPSFPREPTESLNPDTAGGCNPTNPRSTATSHRIFSISSWKTANRLMPSQYLWAVRTIFSVLCPFPFEWISFSFVKAMWPVAKIALRHHDSAGRMSTSRKTRPTWGLSAGCWSNVWRIDISGRSAFSSSEPVSLNLKISKLSQKVKFFFDASNQFIIDFLLSLLVVEHTWQSFVPQHLLLLAHLPIKILNLVQSKCYLFPRWLQTQTYLIGCRV